MQIALLLVVAVLPAVFGNPAAQWSQDVYRWSTVNRWSTVYRSSTVNRFSTENRPSKVNRSSTKEMDTCTIADSPVTEEPLRCQDGYARHRNGRCYRVVDKPQDGGAVAKHEYRVSPQKTCLEFPDKSVRDLESWETLDLCDEDGGCYALYPGVAEMGCASGYIRDANDVCRKLARLKSPRPPSKDDSKK